MEATSRTVHDAVHDTVPCGEDENSSVVAAYYNKPMYQVSWADDFDDELVSRLEERSRKEQEDLVAISENPSCSDVVDRQSSVAEVFVSDTRHEDDAANGVTEKDVHVDEEDGQVVEGELAEPVIGQAVGTWVSESAGRRDTCPADSHHFSSFTARDDNYYCADCHAHVPRGDEVVGCGYCPRDLCAACYDISKQVPFQIRPQTSMPPMPPPPDMGTGGHAIEPVASKAVYVRPPTTYGHKKARRTTRKRQDPTPLPVPAPVHSSASSSRSHDSDEGRAASISPVPSYYSHSPYARLPNTGTVHTAPAQYPHEDTHAYDNTYNQSHHGQAAYESYEQSAPQYPSYDETPHHEDVYASHHDSYPAPSQWHTDRQPQYTTAPFSPQDYYYYN